MSKIEVAVSPHYRGNGWTDRGTGITFKPQGVRLKTRVIDLEEEEDISGIKNSIRLNHLLIVKGQLPDDTPDEPEKINPEELSGEALDELLAGKGGNDPALAKKNQKLAKENEQLRKEIEELKNLVKELESTQGEAAEDTIKRNKDGSVSKSALSDDHTRDELVDLAKKKGVKHNKKVTKADLVDLLAKEL